MKFTVTIKKSAAKSLEALPTKVIRTNVANAILSLADNPRPTNSKASLVTFGEFVLVIIV